ncbi:MAG: HD domain-containing protein [Spirochaetales bacterium]|nr:HD domain-containing protein [Spirochaetales bacterium]
MVKTSITQLKINHYYNVDLYLDKNFLLLPVDVQFTKDIADNLKKWNIRNVLSHNELQEIAEQDRVAPLSFTSSITAGVEEQQGKQKAEIFFRKNLEYVNSLFRDFRNNEKLNLNQVSDKIKEIIKEVKTEPVYILRLASLPGFNFDYMVTHATKTTILSLAMGDKLKLPQHKLVELGISCLFHEIGLLKLPERLYNGAGVINEDEKKSLSTHTILSFRILKTLNVSRDVLLGVLEHHERENGTGYPQKLSGDKISLFGKIISIACSFDAQISDRPFRKGKDAHTSLVTMMQQMNVMYDDKLLKLLVGILTIYPLGCYVQMDNGSVARSVGINQENTTFPMMQQITTTSNLVLTERPIFAITDSNKGQVKKVYSISEAKEFEEKYGIN